MLKIKFFGVTKKAFSCEELEIEENLDSLNDLVDYLLKNKPANTPELDFENILIAINGIDSSALSNRNTDVKDGDIISIIPIIHGGTYARTRKKRGDLYFEFFEIDQQELIPEEFLETLRQKHPRLVIQGISSNFILNKSYLSRIIKISIEAKKNQILLANKIELDLLLRIAGTSQIKQAIKKAGVKKGQKLAVIAIGKKNLLNDLFNFLKPFLNKSPLSLTNEEFLKTAFKISETQMNSIISKNPLEDLLVERAAVLI